MRGPVRGWRWVAAPAPAGGGGGAARRRRGRGAAPFSPALLLFPSPALFPAPAAAWRAQPEASVAQAAALPPGERAEWDVAVVLPPAAAHAAVRSRRRRTRDAAVAAGGGAEPGCGGGGGGAGCGGGGGAAGSARRGAGGGGAPFGGCLGFPSGPSSSLACATTSGAVCACDGAAASCSAVRAVVASSESSKFCHDGGVPGKILATRFGNMVCQQTLAINEQALGRIVASFKPELAFISGTAKSECALVHCAFRPSFQIVALHFPLAAIRCTLARSPLRSRYFRCRSRVRGCSVPAVRAPAIPPACGLATPLAVMAHRVPAWAVAPRAEGFRAGSPAAAPTAARA